MSGAVADFASEGFLGPLPLFSSDECRAILSQLEREGNEPGSTWPKDNFPDWLVNRIAANDRLIELLLPILGDDVILWGVSVVRRSPEMLHPWHVDVESSAPDGRFVTAWIGLDNVTGESGLRLIARSHRCKSVQQIRFEKGRSRTEHSNEWILSCAEEEDPETHLVQPDVSDGDAILFDGRIWHGSYNASKGTRTALLLQFAAADSPIRIPDGLDWPFRFLDKPWPPVVLVHGKPNNEVNNVVPPGQTSAPAQVILPLRSSIRKLGLPLAEAWEGWRRFPLLRGSTAALDFMSCHAAILSAGYSPHPPHAHADEELLMVLAGEADLLIADGPSYDRARPVRAKAGDFAYYPPGQHHTIRNPGTSPVAYMMFRWRTGRKIPKPTQLGTTLFRAPPPAAARSERAFVTRSVFSAPTTWLRKLTCHVSRLEPGAGYAAHADPYDVAILVRSGRVRTLCREVGAGGLVYCSAGELHGMRNIGDEPAHYIVFEFHGREVSLSAAPPAAAGAKIDRRCTDRSDDREVLINNQLQPAAADYQP
ncbi:MAG TPA: cupin domain-containing protein [Sphingomicrobium sp.]|nr:cupin domain-containing protein [Sphingomicrobium sp.]